MPVLAGDWATTAGLGEHCGRLRGAVVLEDRCAVHGPTPWGRLGPALQLGTRAELLLWPESTHARP